MLDISSYLASQFDVVVPQTGMMLGISVSSVDGLAGLGVSATGVVNSVFGGKARSDGSRIGMSMPIRTTVTSPISNRNLLFLREQQAGASDITVFYTRVLGDYM